MGGILTSDVGKQNWAVIAKSPPIPLLCKAEQSSALSMRDASNVRNAQMAGKESKQAEEHESRLILLNNIKNSRCLIYGWLVLLCIVLIHRIALYYIHYYTYFIDEETET